MQPTGNVVAGTIFRTAELGLTIIDAADAGDITIIDAVPEVVGVFFRLRGWGSLGYAKGF